MPSNNKYYRHVGVKVLLSAAGRRYRADVLACVVLARMPKAPAGRLLVELDLYPPNRIRRDLDNAPKSLLDALTHAGVIADDSLIDRLVLTRRQVVPGGKVVVRIDAWKEQ